jgi:hypothetical protein
MSDNEDNLVETTGLICDVDKEIELVKAAKIGKLILIRTQMSNMLNPNFNQNISILIFGQLYYNIKKNLTDQM